MQFVHHPGQRVWILRQRHLLHPHISAQYIREQKTGRPVIIHPGPRWRDALPIEHYTQRLWTRAKTRRELRVIVQHRAASDQDGLLFGAPSMYEHIGVR